MLRTVRRRLRKRYGHLLKRYASLCGSFYQPGTANWLIEREIRYGGFVSGVPRQRISEFEPRDMPPGIIGGDRFSPPHHNYGRVYQRHLARFLSNRSSVVLIEAGILRGTGLAIWSELFPHGRIIGLDIDLSHFFANFESLIARGGTNNRNYEVHVYDAYVDNRQHFADILQGDIIDIFIDDAAHTDESVLMTFQSQGFSLR